MSGKPIDGVVQALIEVAVGKVQHLYRGTCPDAIEGFDSRDPQCPACQVLTAAQQQQQNGGEAGAFDANFLRHIASVCRATYDLCQPKPQRTPEDVREHYGELCLLELTSIADEIERRLTASSGKAGEVAGWVRGDTFVDAKFWTADTPPQGWTPVYLTAPQPAAVDAEVWLFKGTDGEWRTFHNEQHMLDTIADGRWEVRKFYACTPPVVLEEGE